MTLEQFRPLLTDPDLLGALAAIERTANNAANQRYRTRSPAMNLPDRIYAHARALPADLQREALDFIAWLEKRYDIQPPPVGGLSTAMFIQRFAGSFGDDFPDDIGETDWAADTPREALE